MSTRGGYQRREMEIFWKSGYEYYHIPGRLAAPGQITVPELRYALAGWADMMLVSG